MSKCLPGTKILCTWSPKEQAAQKSSTGTQREHTLHGRLESKPRSPKRTIRRRKTLRYGRRDGRLCLPTCEWKQVDQTGQPREPNRLPQPCRPPPEFHLRCRQLEHPQPDPPPHARWTRSTTTSAPRFAPSAPRCPPASQRTERSRSSRLFASCVPKANLRLFKYERV